MRLLSNLNSGLCLYSANSDSHAVAVVGGKDPVTGRHSVMLRPDSVRRVRPPKITMPKTEAAEASSQYPTAEDETSGHDDVEEVEVEDVDMASRRPGAIDGLLAVVLWSRFGVCGCFVLNAVRNGDDRMDL